jgi:hypothetical protein
MLPNVESVLTVARPVKREKIYSKPLFFSFQASLSY